MNETGFAATVMAAIIGGAISLFALALNAIIGNRRERTSRQRQEFSEAFAACMAYKEFAYVVRRRRSDAPQDERVRISSELSNIQRELAYYSAWLATESIGISRIYEALVAKLREVAGAKIREAWLTPPIDSDGGMNMPDLGLSELKPLEEAYLQQVAWHLSAIPRPIRRLTESLSHKTKKTK